MSAVTSAEWAAELNDNLKPSYDDDWLPADDCDDQISEAFRYGYTPQGTVIDMHRSDRAGRRLVSAEKRNWNREGTQHVPVMTVRWNGEHWEAAS